MNTDQARTLVRNTIAEVVPGADVASLAPEARFREALELDSLDFVELVERLSDHAGCRLDELDYPRLDTLDHAAALLAERS